MCYSDDARPPLPPIGGAAAEQGDMHLTSAGNRLLLAELLRHVGGTGVPVHAVPAGEVP